MDELESKISDIDPKFDDVYLAANAEQFWINATGLNPSYVEVLRVDSLLKSYPRAFVEIDGIRLSALIHTRGFIVGVIAWDIAETLTGYGFMRRSGPELSLRAIEPYLKRRQRRLRKRGLYQG